MTKPLRYARCCRPLVLLPYKAAKTWQALNAVVAGSGIVDDLDG